MPIHRRDLWLVLGFGSLSACADGDAGDDALRRSINAAAATGGGTGEYRLGAGDKLRIVVFGEDQMTGEYAVDPNGNIGIPLVGIVEVTNRTTSDVTAEIARRLRQSNLLRDPNVTVQIVETRPFYVLGEVQRPGEYRYRAGLSAAAAVAMAGGFTFRANQRRFRLTRPGYAGAVMVDASTTFTVQPGDVLEIPERFF